MAASFCSTACHTASSGMCESRRSRVLTSMLLGWGSSLLVTQLLTLTGAGLAASIGLMGLVFSTGTTLGRDLNLFVRRLRVE